ncbi:MAG: hypothetical protein E7646_02650 [Ruminococcaceae bacterium]|nr:hypothetical protein [Oscillospiraceae bacterium]
MKKEKIIIGWAEESLTPDKKLSLRGQFYERVSQYVESELTVTAMALTAGEESVIFCSCDLTSVEKELVSGVKERLQGTDIPLDRIIISATHTHTSHTYRRERSEKAGGLGILKKYIPDDMVYKPAVDFEGVMDPCDAYVFLCERIALAAKRAWEQRRASSYACGFGRAAVGMCRRVCFNDGSARMWGDADNATFTELEGGNDSGIELLYTFDENKKLTGVVANVACPSQVLEHRSFVSSDYWGKVKDFVRKKLGEDVFVLGLCSAAGDQCPRDLIRWVQPDTPILDPNVERLHPRDRRADPSMFEIKGAVKAGKRIANEIIDVFEELGESCDECELIHSVTDLKLPLRRVTPEDCANAKKAITEFVRENKGKTVDYMDTAMMHVHAGTINRFEYQYDHDFETVELHCIRLGDVAFVTNPFELFLDYGNRIRARSLAKQTFIIQLANGSQGYLPTAKAEKGGHYSAYVSSGYVGSEGGELLVRECVDTVNGFFKE